MMVYCHNSKFHSKEVGSFGLNTYTAELPTVLLFAGLSCIFSDCSALSCIFSLRPAFLAISKMVNLLNHCS